MVSIHRPLGYGPSMLPLPYKVIPVGSIIPTVICKNQNNYVLSPVLNEWHFFKMFEAYYEWHF